MTTIKNFEELKAWQKARELAGYVYELTRQAEFPVIMGCAIKSNVLQVL